MDKPLVSICCCAFNHEPYIQRCLDGFVEQRTLFPFEILIHDDASTDKTASIIAAYAQRFPALFKPIYQTENQYSKGNDPCTRILFPMARGKYIAICEGDDYWTDPLKLQKQVDYMEAHPDCSMCFGNAVEHWEDKSRPDRSFSSVESREYLGIDICWNWMVPTASVLFRKDIIDTTLFKESSTNPRMAVGDLPLFLTCAEYGHLFAFSDYFSVYRRHGEGFTLNFDAARRMKMGEMWEEIPIQFGAQYNEVSLFYAVYHYRVGMMAAMKERNPSLRKRLLLRIIRLYLLHPINAGKRLLRVIRERLPSSREKWHK